MNSVPSLLTYCTHESGLLRVWGIIDYKRYEKISDILLTNKDRLAEGTGRPTLDTDLSYGTLILVKLGSQFKRALIIGQKTYMESFLVNFIDVGNTEIVLLDNIRMPSALPELKELDSAPCAQDFILSDALVRPYPWSSEDRQNVNISLKRHCKVQFVDTVAGKTLISWSVYDTKGAVPVCTFLMECELADCATLEDVKAAVIRHGPFSQVPIAPQPIIHQTTLVQHPHAPPDTIPPSRISPQVMNDDWPVRPSTCLAGYPFSLAAVVSQPAIRAQPLKVPEIVPLPAIRTQPPHVDPLPVGTQQEVHISHVIDAAQSFMVQLKENLEGGKLRKLMEQINDSSIHHKPIELCYAGLTCLGRYSGDAQLRRAVVSKVLTDGADLLFVDFGNSETVPLSEIYKIPSQFLEEPTMALQFTLARVSTNPALLTKKARRMFEELTEGADRLLLCVTKPEVQAKQYCELFIFDNEGAKINIREKILDEMNPEKQVVYDRLTFKPNSSKEVEIRHAETPIRFFVKLGANKHILQSLEDSLRKDRLTLSMKSFSCIEDVNDNMAVCAKCRWSGQQWLRGLTVGEPMDDGNVEIFLVDHGFKETLHFSQLRILNNGIISRPPMQAVECRLDIDADFALREEVSEAFCVMIGLQSHRMKVIDVLPTNVLLVDLFDEQGRNERDLLLSKFGMVKTITRRATKPSESAASQKTGVGGNSRHIPNNRGAEISVEQKMHDEMEIMKRVEYARLSFKENNSHKVLVTHIETPIRFFVQLEVHQSLLHERMDSFDQYYKRWPLNKITSIEGIHDSMAVWFTCPNPTPDYSEWDDRGYIMDYGKPEWLRGLVVGKPMEDGYVDVFNVDKGDTKTVHFSYLKVMNNGLFTKLPMQAVECRLDLDADFALREEVVTAFNNRIEVELCGIFQLKVIKILPEKVLLVDLLDKCGEKVKDALLSEFSKVDPIIPSASFPPASAASQKTGIQ